MSEGFVKPKLPVLVFTDLDGTLLDHDDYSFSAAAPALALLRELHIPVIANTSKTLAELEALNQAMDNTHPCIVENGSALCIPSGYFSAVPGATTMPDYQVIRLAPEYTTLIETLHRLRSEKGYRFRGFYDMSAEQVAADTGLSVADAARAKRRLCSEPLIWEDSPEAFDQFESALDDVGFSLTRGGRYWHVMAQQGKAQAMQQMQGLYETATGTVFTTIGLGDSPNDEAMLRAADIAIIVRRPDGTHLECEGAKRVLHTRSIGPAGWNESMHKLIDELASVYDALLVGTVAVASSNTGIN